MSHDLYASWATSELANIFKDTPDRCFRDPLNRDHLSLFANRESGRNWPIPDGRITADLQNSKYEIAVELKRTNEGLHGVLTAIGQSQAYINPDKGYTASVIVIPRNYDSRSNPGDYIANVINHVNPDLPVGVYSYEVPDTSIASPFRNKLQCHRDIGISLANAITNTNPLSQHRSNTQWAHLREGSSEPHAFFVYLQIAKGMVIDQLEEPTPNIPAELIAAVNRIAPGVDPIKYLSYSVGDIFHDVVWRNFWFKYVLTDDVIIPWKRISGTFQIHDVETKLIAPDGNGYKKFFSGRSDSIKNRLVREINTSSISISDAWDQFATNIHNRAHSYREDVDSGLEHLGFIESDGKPSELGYRYVDVCERSRDCFNGTPKLILGSTILKNGSLGALLHYFYKLSEQRLKTDPLAFTSTNASGRIVFNKDDYLNWIKAELANNLKVMNTASLRGGSTRRAFQAELAILRKFDFVSGFRVGLGLEINWPLVQEYLEFD